MTYSARQEIAPALYRRCANDDKSIYVGLQSVFEAFG